MQIILLQGRYFILALLVFLLLPGPSQLLLGCVHLLRVELGVGGDTDVAAAAEGVQGAHSGYKFGSFCNVQKDIGR